jgi:ABC-type bacteriocin/lantibiotic exporter with double-glycine peptidase domain
VTEQAAGVFRPEAVRRHLEGDQDAPPASVTPRSGFGLWWGLTSLSLGALLLTPTGRGLIAKSTHGFVGGRAPSILTAAAVLGGLVATTGLMLLARGLSRRRRIPVLLQMSAAECGAACLAMVLSYYGRGTRVAECAEGLGAGRDGLTARAIAEGARRYGLRVRAYSVSPDKLGLLGFPAIVHWNFNHFVVVERVKRGRVHIIDPSQGRRRLTADEFDRGFTGVALICTPTPELERRKAPRARWLPHAKAIALRQRRLVGQLLVASLILQFLGLGLPLVSKLVIDDVLPHHQYGEITILAAGIAVIVASQTILAFLRASLLVELRARLEGQLVPLLLKRLLSLPYRFFERRNSGDLIARLASVSSMRELMTAQAVSTILDGTLAVGYLTLVLTQDSTMGLAVLGVVAVQAILVSATASASRELAQRELSADAAAQSYLVEALSGIATLKASGTEERARRRWNVLFAEQVSAGRGYGQQTASIQTALTGLQILAPLGLLLLGASSVLHGHMSVGTMLATTALATGALTPFGSLIGNAQKIQLVTAQLDRLGEIVLATPEDSSAGMEVTALKGEIEVRDVSFRYDEGSPLAVRRVSLRIPAGQKVAIVGRSGSGKTTLGKLLLQLYEPTAGSIHYDGVPAADLGTHALRRQFGVVLQEPVLFSGSIRDNITLSAPGAPLSEVIEAASLAEIRGDIEAMPMGYETQLTESGLGLSGGQRQRLALARAVLHKPAVLLLDEATSHLDAVTESAISDNLNAIGCTRIVIAHRLSTIRDADHIVVMEGGRVVEQGAHDDLVARNGVYAALTRQQEDAGPWELMAPARA